MVSTKYFCQDCKKELTEGQKPCPYCGGGKRDIRVEIQETIKIRESLRGRQKRKGFKKFMIEFLQGWFRSKDKARFPEGVQKTRVIDRESNKYQERIINEATGKIEVDKNEKLSDHK